MQFDLDQIDIQLAKRGLLPVRVDSPMSFRCLAGTIWLTQLGKFTDVVLEPGQAASIDRRGEVVLQALEAGVVRVAMGVARRSMLRPANVSIEPEHTSKGWDARNAF
jgi:hypothetical protein